MKDGSGPAAVIPVPEHPERNLTDKMPLVLTTGKAGKGRESQKTCLNTPHMQDLRGKRL